MLSVGKTQVALNFDAGTLLASRLSQVVICRGKEINLNVD